MLYAPACCPIVFQWVTLSIVTVLWVGLVVVVVVVVGGGGGGVGVFLLDTNTGHTLTLSAIEEPHRCQFCGCPPNTHICAHPTRGR